MERKRDRERDRERDRDIERERERVSGVGSSEECERIACLGRTTSGTLLSVCVRVAVWRPAVFPTTFHVTEASEGD